MKLVDLLRKYSGDLPEDNKKTDRNAARRKKKKIKRIKRRADYD